MSAEQLDLFTRFSLVFSAPFDADAFRWRPRFDGATFDDALDADRLTRQLDAVRRWMLGHGWQSLVEIADGAGYGVAAVASISARLRDLRKPKFGGYVVERRRRTAGTWEYRILPPTGEAA